MKKLSTLKTKAIAGCCSVMATAELLSTRVFASAIHPNGNVNVETGMAKIIGFLVTVTTYVGVGVLVYGGYELAMSFTQDMPDKKVKGVAFIIGGLILVAIKSLLRLLGVIA